MNFYSENYGATGNGTDNDATAIQQAIDECSQAGGGRVVLRSGKTYYSSSLILKPGVDLHLERGAMLKAHADITTYFCPNGEDAGKNLSKAWKPVVLKPAYTFIYAKDADFIAISGEGVIDGNSSAFIHRFNQYYCSGDYYPRPTMVYVEHCNHITFQDVVLQNSPFWTLHPAGCDDVLISRIRILNKLDEANSDGIDPDHSTNVRIIGCHITCADDCICLKASSGNMEYGPTKNVLVSDCTLVSTSSAIKIGTEGTGDFENLTVTNCIISNSNRGISIQIRDKGNVRNAAFSNIIIETRRFEEHWWGRAEAIAITSVGRAADRPSGNISNIRFHNITCYGENGVFLSAGESGQARDITFDQVHVTLKATSRWPKGQYDMRPGYNAGVEEIPSKGFYMRGVHDITLRNCTAGFEGEDLTGFGEAFAAENCTGITMEGFQGKAAQEGMNAIVMNNCTA